MNMDTVNKIKEICHSVTISTATKATFSRRSGENIYFVTNGFVEMHSASGIPWADVTDLSYLIRISHADDHGTYYNIDVQLYYDLLLPDSKEALDLLYGVIENISQKYKFKPDPAPSKD